MLPEKYRIALIVISKRLAGTDWCLVGSSNLVLQGLAVGAGDIDIKIPIRDVDFVQKALQEYCVKPIKYSENEKFRSYFGQFTIQSISIDVMSDLSVHTNSGWIDTTLLDFKTIQIGVDGAMLPCLDLKSEWTSYKLLGRTEMTERIRRFIEERKQETLDRC